MASLQPDQCPGADQPLAVQAAFLTLREAFVAGLPQRWVAIEAAASDEQRRQALHRLAGAAGSYGFTTLGEAARAAEQALAQPASAKDVAAFQAAWGQLKHLLGARSDTL